MEFSIFLSHMRIHPDAHYRRNLYDEKLAEAKIADACGFCCLWVPEHHLIQYMQAPSGLLLLLHYGQHVKCPLGQMVNLLVYRHPLIGAGEIAQADQLLGGRLHVGVGRGAYEYEFRRLGISWETANEQFAECMDVLKKVWSSPEDGIEHAGRFFRFEKTYVWPRPMQTPHPPLWFAAMSPPGIEYGAQQGYNVSTWPFLAPMSMVEKNATAFVRARAKTGRTPASQKLSVMRPVYVARTEKKARASVETMLTNHRLSQRIREPGAQSDGMGFVSNARIPDEPTPDETFERMIVGTPQQCIDKLALYRDLGVDQFMAWFDFGMESEENLDTMRLFAEEVMPAFR